MYGAYFEAISGCDGEEIEPSIYILRIDGETLILDAGYNDQMKIDSVLTKLENLDPYPKGILVSHAHIDHIGLLPCIHNIFPDVPIVMTPLTRIFAKVILEDVLNLSLILSQFLESASDIKKTLDFCKNYERNFDETIHLENIEVKILRAGHVPGAASFLVRGKRGTIVLYTGDFSLTDFLTVSAATLPKETEFIDVLITETTYGNKSHPPRSKQIEDFIYNINKVLERGGRVLIPSFALGRAQEILAILIKKMIDKDLNQYPIYLAGMALTITKAYDGYASTYMPHWTLENIGKMTGYGKEKGAYGIVHLLENRNNWDELAMYKGPSIFIASSGMLTGGPSVLFARHILEEEASAVFFVGFLDEESLGKKLLDLKKARKKGGVIRLLCESGQPQIVRVKCDIFEHKLSAHSDQNQLVEFAYRWTPRAIILVHGPSRFKEPLAQMLKKKLRCDIYIPRNGEEIFVPGIEHCEVCGSRLIIEEMFLKVHPEPNLCSKFWLPEDNIDEVCVCGSKEFKIAKAKVLRCPKKPEHFLERLGTGRIYKKPLKKRKAPKLPKLQKIKHVPTAKSRKLKLSDKKGHSFKLRLINTTELLYSIVKCVHEKIEEKIPLGLFLRVLIGDEFARYELLWNYGYSIVVDRGQNPEFSINERNKEIVLKKVKDLIYEKLDPPISRKVWSELEAPIHEHEISTMLFRRTFNDDIKVTLHNLLSRVDPEWKKQLQNSELFP
jgi:Cft2 family RNA processing exonuclease